jgi:hypothetical protein
MIERLIRTLKEQCVYLHRAQSPEQTPRIIATFIALYNTDWLIERLGQKRTPPKARRRRAEAGVTRIGQNTESRIAPGTPLPERSAT